LSVFKGAISNAEREYLQGLYQSWERSGFANRAILTSLMDGFEKAIETAQLRADSKNFDDYNTKQKSRREKARQEEEDTVIDFDAAGNRIS
jgi:hypothetical protein